MAGTVTTGWVAGITSGTPTPLDFTSQPRDVTEEFEAVSPWDIPFVKRAGGWNSFVVRGRRDHEWQEEDLWKQSLTISSTTGITATDGTTLTLSGNDAYRVLPGTLAKIDSEIVLISALATASTLTIVREMSGTTAATHATAATVQLIGQAREEGTDSPYFSNRLRTFYTNYPQFFDGAIQISEQSRNQDLYGRDKEDEQVEVQTKHLAKMAERSAIEGEAYAGAANKPPTMGGVLDFITTANGSYNTSLSSAALAESNLYTAIRSILDNVGESNVARTIVTRYFLRQKISGFYENRIRTEQGDHTGGVAVDAIDTDFGRFEIMHFHSWPESVVGFLNFDKIKLGHTAGMMWQRKRLAEAGAYFRETLYGEYTLEVRNPQCMGQITAVSTSS